MASIAIPGTSKELLERIEERHLSMRQAIGALPAERWEEALPAGWTLKEMVGHLAYWESTVAPYVEALRAGTPREPGGDVDEKNARAAAEVRELPREEVLRRWDEAHAQVLAVVGTFTEDEARDERLIEKLEGETYGHYPDHYADLGAAIRAAGDLTAIVQQSWIPFRLAIEALGLPRLERASPDGRTYKDLVAHVAAWEELTASRLATMRETGEFPGAPDADTFNAQVTARTAARDARDVIRELDVAHRRIADEIGRLSPEQLRANDAWASTIVAGNTYGHYGEHHAPMHAGVPKTPRELAETMRVGWRRFRGTLRRVGLIPLSNRTASGWTLKGMLGHVAYWMEEVPAELPVRLAGRRSRLPEIDVENAKAAAAGERSSAHALVERVDAAYRGVVDAVAALAQDDEIDFMAIRLVAGETYGHFREHAEELESALPGTTADVLRRFDETWTPFRAAVRERGPSGLSAASPAGWSYHDMCAHAAAWMRQAVREIESGEFSSWDQASIQAFNDRAVEAHRLAGPEALLEELDASHHRIRQAIAALSGERIADRTVFAVVAFCTYLHWEEHFDELGIAI